MADSGDYILRKLANEMQGLADSVNSQNPHVGVRQFLKICPLFDLEKFGCGPAFHFANVEIADQLEHIKNKTGPDETVQSAIERDIAQGTARQSGSLSRRLYRLKRMVEFAMVIMEQIVENPESESISDVILRAYGQVFAPYHGPMIRALILSVKDLIPSMPTFLTAVNEDANTMKEPLNKFVAASKVVIQHFESVFQSNESSAKLTRLV